MVCEAVNPSLSTSFNAWKVNLVFWNYHNLNRLSSVCFLSSTYQMIRLRNPTDESLVLTPHCSNANNFSLELDNSKQILLAAGSVLEVPLKFTPSAIGNLQSAEVSFHCPQVKCRSAWYYLDVFSWKYLFCNISQTSDLSRKTTCKLASLRVVS